MKKYFNFIITLFLIMFIGSYCLAVEQMGKEHHKGHHQQGSEEQKLELSGNLENGIRVIEVKASKYKFEPDPIVVKLGDKVRLVITSTDVKHGLAITEFNINIVAPVGEEQPVEFVADKEGTFHIRCSVYCGPGHSNMHGRFIVIRE